MKFQKKDSLFLNEEGDKALLIVGFEPEEGKFYEIPESALIEADFGPLTIYDHDGKEKVVQFYTIPVEIIEGLERKNKSEREGFPPPPKENEFFVDPLIWNGLIFAVRRKKSILLIGETGSGKTELVSRIGKYLEMDVSTFDMSIKNLYAALIGRMMADRGSTFFQKSRFLDAIQRPGIILLDELSRSEPTAANLLLPLLDSRREIYVEETGHIYKVHPETIFVATANVGSKYTGASVVDPALMDRMLCFQIGYPPASVVSQILEKRTGIDEKNAKVISRFMAKVNSQDLDELVSMRAAITIAEMLVDGFSLVEALELLYKHSEDYDAMKAIALAVKV